jgi:hypothetical protein
MRFPRLLLRLALKVLVSFRIKFCGSQMPREIRQMGMVKFG